MTPPLYIVTLTCSHVIVTCSHVIDRANQSTVLCCEAGTQAFICCDNRLESLYQTKQQVKLLYYYMEVLFSFHSQFNQLPDGVVQMGE